MVSSQTLAVDTPPTEPAGVPTSTLEETGVPATAPVGVDPGAAAGAAPGAGSTTGADCTHHRGPLPKTKSRAYGAQLSRDGDIQKYKAKYKDLKLKVKQIEKDNDKLLLKILKAKKDIQRARLERAIIYERLSVPIEPPAPTDPSLPSYESHFLPPAPPATASSLPAHTSQPDALSHLSPTAQTKVKEPTDGPIDGELGQESSSKPEEPTSGVSVPPAAVDNKDDTIVMTDADAEVEAEAEASASVSVSEPPSGSQPNGPLSPSPPSPSESTSASLAPSASSQPPAPPSAPVLSNEPAADTEPVSGSGPADGQEGEEERLENGKMVVDEE